MISKRSPADAIHYVAASKLYCHISSIAETLWRRETISFSRDFHISPTFVGEMFPKLQKCFLNSRLEYFYQHYFQ